MNFNKFNLFLYTQYIYFPLLMILNVLFFVMCITRNSDEIKKCLLPVAMLASFTLAGCQSNADDHAADVYQTDQLNTKQETKTVNIISILPAKVAVDNAQNKRNAQAFGALIGAVAGGVIGHNVGSGSNSGTTAGAVGGGAVGAAAGSMVNDKTLVEGVSLTYKEGTKVYTSTRWVRVPVYDRFSRCYYHDV